MSTPDQPFDPSTDNAGDSASGTEDEVVQGDEGEIPVQGDESTADDLAKKAFGDKDRDDEGDVPNVPFPG